MSEPIPLIVTSDEFRPGYSLAADKDDSLEQNLARYGNLILAFTWLLFLITVNSLFQCWRWIIEPLAHTSETAALHAWLGEICESIDYLVVSAWCIYVAVWWWALLSWVGLKLFRQSKGIQT